MGRVKIRELFNLTNDAIIICALDGRALDANRVALEMFSGGSEKIMNTLPLSLLTMPKDCKFSVQDHWNKVVSGREDDFECRMTRPGESSTFFVHVNLRRVTCSISALWDLSEPAII